MYRDKLASVGRRSPQMYYESHDDVSTKSGSQSKSMYTLGGGGGGGGHDYR